jgi:DNA polymerase III epsilon subunit-like protein
MKECKPIVMDIETSGLDMMKCGIWQIGAVDLENMEEFFDEARIDDEDQIIGNPNEDQGVLEIIGKTEEELRDTKKQSQKELIKKFLKWISKRSMKIFVCQNMSFDVAFLKIKVRKYGLKKEFHHRNFDLHSIAQSKYFELNKKFLVEEDHSAMGLSKILEFVGMEDNRKIHNALEDCKLTAECFTRLMIGKKIFPEYAKFNIPTELKKVSTNTEELKNES